MKLSDIFIFEDYNYRGDHTAPLPDGRNSLNDPYDIYGGDIYTNNALRYFGTGEDSIDYMSISVIQSAKDKPNKKIKIYRAVPYKKSPKEKLNGLQRAMDYYLKTKKIHPDYDDGGDPNSWYDRAWEERENLQDLKDRGDKEKLEINPGDWVTINRQYAKDHGVREFDKNFKILSKVVPARTLHTTGDSIHEWGYNP